MTIFRLVAVPVFLCYPVPRPRPQILVIAFSVFRMHRPVSRLNILGLFLVLLGAVRYTIISRREKRLREKRGLGSVKKSAQSKASNGFAAADPSSAPLLPTTVVKTPTIGTVGGVMVNGKGSKIRGGGERKVTKGEGKTVGWSWWAGKKGDASRRR